MKRLLFTFAAVLAFALMGQTASADTLHGFCWGGATCADNGTNTPTNVDPPKFGFNGSGGDVTGDLDLVFLVPVGSGVQPASIGVGGTVSGTANFVGIWTTGQLDSFLGISASPTNPIGAYSAGNISNDGFFVYSVDLGTQTLGGNSDPSTGPEETTTISLPTDSYVVGFLNIPGDRKWSATANSGAIFEDGTPTPPVPEPSSLMLLGTGALGLAGVVRRRFGRR